MLISYMFFSIENYLLELYLFKTNLTHKGHMILLIGL